MDTAVRVLRDQLKVAQRRVDVIQGALDALGGGIVRRRKKRTRKEKTTKEKTPAPKE